MTKLTFYEWLIKQQKRDDVVGDLAQDAMRDKEAASLANYQAWRLHLHRAHRDVQAALNEAWLEYEPSTVLEIIAEADEDEDEDD